MCTLGHQVTVLYGSYDRPHTVDRALKACQAELSNFMAMPMLQRKQWLRLSNVRQMVDYANYLRPQHPTPWEARRWRRQIAFKPVSKALKYSKMANRILAKPRVFHLLKRIERRIPPDPAILGWLKAQCPDVVIASPYIVPRTGEIEYIQAARALDIPTIAIVLSWDNLTTKGTFHIMPDAVLVWNEALLKEAMAFHDVPQDRILITGAPVFDFWFEMRSTLDYASFCDKVGINAKQPFVLYLCSSKYISGDETAFVKAFAKALRYVKDTQKTRILVRPHPLNAAIWQGIEDELITVWPQNAFWVDTPEAKQDYYHSIYHSRAVIGVNTSAIIEAAICDRPCVTILDAEYNFKQNGHGHFGHLISADFMEITHSFAESATVIAAVLAGKDSKKEQRLRFVSNFIRPQGLDRSASEIMAKAIESAALGKDIQRSSDESIG
ncbi:MAG: hypothetical protein PVJ41_10085 [Desulfobacterales bacterium]